MPELLIAGVTFEAPERFAEGHTLTAVEAAALNQTYYENLSNNFSPKVKKLKKNGDVIPEDLLAGIRAEFAQYANDYQFRGKALSKAPTDPIGAIAVKLAREKINEALRGKNIKKEDLPEGRYDELVNELALTNESIRAEAKRRLDAMNAISTDVLGL